MLAREWQAEGRISLRVMTEVSEVSTENALTGGQNGTTIPSIKTRRAETADRSDHRINRHKRGQFKQPGGEHSANHGGHR